MAGGGGRGRGGGGGGSGGGGGVTEEKEKSIRLSAFTANIQNGSVIPRLPSPRCRVRKYLFKLILNLIHLFLRPLRCSSAGVSPHVADGK